MQFSNGSFQNNISLLTVLIQHQIVQLSYCPGIIWIFLFLILPYPKSIGYTGQKELIKKTIQQEIRQKFYLSSSQNRDSALVLSLGRCYKVYNNMMMMMITIVTTIRQPQRSMSRAMMMIAISNTSQGKLIESELKQLHTFQIYSDSNYSCLYLRIFQFSSVQSLSRVRLFANP